MKQADLELWLANEARPGEDGRPVRSARSRNTHRAAAVAFCNWLVGLKPPRMAVNPFDGIPLANEEEDPRRKRRALTEDEIGRLLDVARRRPLLDAQTVRRGPRKGQPIRRLKAATVARLEALGRQRVMIYKVLLMTGLRKGELAALKVADLNLDAAVPHIQLAAAMTKTGEEDFVTLRADLVADLRAWLVERFGPGDPPPARRLFDIGTQFIRVLNRDLKLAKIPKHDAQGRQVDVHALRTTFGIRLSKYGVPPRVAKRLMRHSRLELTMKVYTDARLFDLLGALDAVPPVAPRVAPTGFNSVQPGSSKGNPPGDEDVA
jgi:integrase